MNDALTGLARFGHDLCDWSLATVVNTGILLALAVTADLLLAKRVRPAWRIALYLPIFLRLLLPARLALHVPVWTSPSPASIPLSTFVTTHAAAVPMAATAERVQAGPDLVAVACAVVYLLGVVISGLRWIKDTRDLARADREATAHSTDPRVRVSVNSDAGPMVVGVLAPRILIPAWLLSNNALPLILAHEHAHIVRRDPLLAAAMRLACTLAWPIIPIWIASSRVRALMEQACDEQALCAHGPRQREVIMTYAEALIHVARRSSRRAWTLAFGGSLAARIGALCHDRQWRAAPQLLMVLCIAALLIGCAVVKPGGSERTDSPSTITVTTQPEAASPVQPADTESSAAIRRSARMVSVGPQDIMQPLMMLPPDDAVDVSVRIVDGDLSLGSSSDDDDSVKTIERADLDAALEGSTTARVIAWPRVQVDVSQPAEVRMVLDEVELVVNIVVYPSPAGTAIATVSYAEGATYRLDAQRINAKESQASIIHIPAAAGDHSSRTLIITIIRPSDDC